MFSIKTGDTLPSYAATLLDTDGNAVNITGATGVTFRFKADNVPIISGAGAIVSASAGTVRYDWQAGDTDTAGDYQVEIVVTYASGSQTFPSAGYGRVRITESLA